MFKLWGNKRLLSKGSIIMIQAENETLMLSTKKDNYAINRHMTRAVLNGFNIDMEVPCKLNIQRREMKEVIETLDKEYREDRGRISHEKSARREEEESAGTSSPQSSEEDETVEPRMQMSFRLAN
jgi:hypothetical protein